MPKFLVAGLVLLALPGCRFNLTTPSPIVNITNTNTNTNANNNNNDNDNNVGQPPGCTSCPPGSGNGSPTAPRAPDPPTGGILPLPTTAEATVRSLAAQNPSLVVQSCAAVFGPAAWAFLDRVVDALRQSDARWGYVCKYGNCADISGDVIAYHASSGPDVQGARGTWEVDIISNHCPDPSMTSAVQWQVIGFSATGVWGTRGRF